MPEAQKFPDAEGDDEILSRTTAHGVRMRMHPASQADTILY